MTRYALFLRGINVGGIRVAMPQLREVLTGLGCRDVRTWLNTGNVMLDDDRDADMLRTVTEQAIGDAFGYDAHVIVRLADQLADLVTAWPFGSDDRCHRYVVLGGAVAHEATLTALSAAGLPAEIDPSGDAPTEAVAVVGDDLMWRCPKGSSTTSPVAKVLTAKQLRVEVTTRNLNTLERML